MSIQETNTEKTESKPFIETLHCFAETVEAMNDLKNEFILLESIKQFAIDFIKADDNIENDISKSYKFPYPFSVIDNEQRKKLDIRNQTKENLRQLLEIE